MFYSFTDKLFFKSYFYHTAFKEERSIVIERCTVLAFLRCFHSRFAEALSVEVTIN